MIDILSSLMIPFLVLFILIYGIFKKQDVYNLFIEGAKESFSMITSLFPSMLAMILGVNIIVKSGFITYIFSFLSDILCSISCLIFEKSPIYLKISVLFFSKVII